MEKPIILFDGVCNLCNRFIQKIIRNDKNDIFLFTAQQSTHGQSIMAAQNISIKQNGAAQTVFLLLNNHLYAKSDAVIKIGSILGGRFKILSLIATVIPKAIRDRMYDYVATHRYKWFGKQNYCMMPTPRLKAKFLD